MLIPCDGGPSRSRLERFPPPVEVIERGGLYVLVDDGPAEAWRYLFVPEVRAVLRKAGFALEGHEEWMSGRPAGLDTWSVCFVARAV